jgi:hypothetical protein
MSFIEKRDFTAEEREILDECVIKCDLLTDWEQKFVDDLSNHDRLTEQQSDKLHEIYRKLPDVP